VVKDLFERLCDWKAEVYVQSLFSDFLRDRFGYIPEIKGDIADCEADLDMALSVGGDGTFLRTVLQIQKQNIPILGINTGRLGFLADVGSSQIDETLAELFGGRYRIEERSLLQLFTENQTFNGFNYALNEIAILKRDTASMITIHTYLNDDYLTSYLADGLLVATPTGSTAYSMSVNGPILLPQNSNFILSPVAPHSLNVRPIVIPDDFTITLRIESRTNSFLVSLDGRSEDLPDGIELKICKADFKTRLIKRLNNTFYQTLREKLMWGADVRS
jgi:NAD+ kinase